MTAARNIFYDADLWSEFTTTASHTTYVLEAGQSLQGSFAPAFTFDSFVIGVSLISEGAISSSFGAAIDVLEDADFAFIRNGRGASITGQSSAIATDALSTRILNLGDMTSLGIESSVVEATFEGAIIENRGTISQSFGLEGVGVSFGRSYSSLVNSGKIQAKAAVIIDADTGAMSVTLTNSGLIKGQELAIGVEGNLLGLRIENEGRILSDGIAVDLSGAEAVLHNDGLIKSTGALADTKLAGGSLPYGIAIYGGAAEQTIVNSGKILGDVHLGDSVDSYFGLNGGVVIGTILGDIGEDHLVGSRAVDVMDGGDDNDTLNGRGGDDILDGGFGADEIIGGDGDDIIHGDQGDDFVLSGRGNDKVWGGDDADWMHGEAGNDVLRGDGGDDTLMGDGGHDKLFGDAGNDRLVGGDGDDRLDGGDDNDTLVFDAGDDVAKGGQGADSFEFLDYENNLGVNTILDFEDGVDLLDLRTFFILDMEAFLNEALTNKKGDAILNLKFADPEDLSHYTGKVIIKDAAGLITIDDFNSDPLF